VEWENQCGVSREEKFDSHFGSVDEGGERVACTKVSNAKIGLSPSKKLALQGPTRTPRRGTCGRRPGMMREGGP